jgi:hypothetical protein
MQPNTFDTDSRWSSRKPERDDGSYFGALAWSWRIVAILLTFPWHGLAEQGCMALSCLPPDYTRRRAGKVQRPPLQCQLEDRQSC